MASFDGTALDFIGETQGDVKNPKAGSYLIDKGVRRDYPRIPGLFPTQIRGKDLQGRKFSVVSLAEDLSIGGVYVQIRHSLQPGDRVFIVVRMEDKFLIAARGQVVRAQYQGLWLYGLGIQFSSVRLKAIPDAS
jgi:hypothetical protein